MSCWRISPASAFKDRHTRAANESVAKLQSRRWEVSARASASVGATSMAGIEPDRFWRLRSARNAHGDQRHSRLSQQSHVA
jgi:hypothetical protein